MGSPNWSHLIALKIWCGHFTFCCVRRKLGITSPCLLSRELQTKRKTSGVYVFRLIDHLPICSLLILSSCFTSFIIIYLFIFICLFLLLLVFSLNCYWYLIAWFLSCCLLCRIWENSLVVMVRHGANWSVRNIQRWCRLNCATWSENYEAWMKREKIQGDDVKH
jgi:hypothetical protein